LDGKIVLQKQSALFCCRRFELRESKRISSILFSAPEPISAAFLRSEKRPDILCQALKHDSFVFSIAFAKFSRLEATKKRLQFTRAPVLNPADLRRSVLKFNK
jgi:hypothetical protein